MSAIGIALTSMKKGIGFDLTNSNGGSFSVWKDILGKNKILVTDTDMKIIKDYNNAILGTGDAVKILKDNQSKLSESGKNIFSGLLDSINLADKSIDKFDTDNKNFMKSLSTSGAEVAKTFNETLNTKGQAEAIDYLIDNQKKLTDADKDYMKQQLEVANATDQLTKKQELQSISLDTLKTKTLAQRAASIALQGATLLLNTALSVLGSLAINFVIGKVVGFVDDVVHAEKKAMDAAVESRDNSIENANAAKEETKSLSELIEKYKELASADIQDSSTRTEIKDIQNQINKLIDDQSGKVNLVNGQLKEQLKLLKSAEKEEASRTRDLAANAYNESIEASQKSAGKLSSWGNQYDAGKLPSEVRKQLSKEMQEVITASTMRTLYEMTPGIIPTINDDFTTSELDLNDVTTMKAAKENGYDLSDAKGKVKFLTELSSQLYNIDTSSITDYVSDISDAINYYSDYSDKVKESAESFLDAAIVMSEFDTNISALDVNSADSLEKYKNSIMDYLAKDKTIENMIKNGDLAETGNNSIESYVNDYISTLDNFDKFYQEWYDKYVQPPVTVSSVFDKIFNSPSLTSDQDFAKAYNKYKLMMKDVVEANELGNFKIDDIFKNGFTWDEESMNKNKEKLQSWYSDALEDWDKFVKDAAGANKQSAMMSSDSFNNIPISYSLLLHTENGDVMMDKSTVSNYIQSVIDKACEKDGTWTPEEILQIDKEGLAGFEESGNQIKNIIAGIGEEAVASWNEVSDIGDVSRSFDSIISASEKAGKSVEELMEPFKLNDWYNSLPESDKKLVQELSLDTTSAEWSYTQWLTKLKNAQDDALKYSNAKIVAMFQTSTEEESAKTFGNQIAAYETKLSDLSAAFENLKSGTYDFTDSSFYSLIKTYPELAQYKDNVDGMTVAVQSMITEMRSDVIAAFNEQIAQVEGDDNAVLKLNKIRDAFLGILDAINTKWSYNIDAEIGDFDSFFNSITQSFDPDGLDDESIKFIFDTYGELEDFNVDDAFDFTEIGLRGNADALRKYQAEVEKATKQDFQDQLREKEAEYNELTEAINNCSDAQTAANLYSQRNEVRKEIDDIRIRAAEYEGLTSKYNKWIKAKSGGESGDNYDAMVDYMSEAKDTYEAGLWGQEGFRAFVDLFTYEDLTTSSADEVKSAYEDMYNTIEGTSYSKADFFDEEQNGVENFCKALQQANSDWASFNESTGKWTLDLGIGQDEDIAKRMGISVESLQVMLMKMKDFGWDINIDSAYSMLNLYESKIQDINKELSDNHVTSKWFNLQSQDTEELTGYLTEVQGLIDGLKVDGQLNFSDENVQKYLSLYTAIYEQIQDINGQSIFVDVDTSNLEDGSPVRHAIEKIQEVITSDKSNKIDLELGIRDEDTIKGEMDAKIQALKDDETTNQFLIACGIDTSTLSNEDLLNAIQTLTPEDIQVAIDAHPNDPTWQSLGTMIDEITQDREVNAKISEESKNTLDEVTKPETKEITADVKPKANLSEVFGTIRNSIVGLFTGENSNENEVKASVSIDNSNVANQWAEYKNSLEAKAATSPAKVLTEETGYEDSVKESESKVEETATADPTNISTKEDGYEESVETSKNEVEETAAANPININTQEDGYKESVETSVAEVEETAAVDPANISTEAYGFKESVDAIAVELENYYSENPVEIITDSSLLNDDENGNVINKVVSYSADPESTQQIEAYNTNLQQDTNKNVIYNTNTLLPDTYEAQSANGVHDTHPTANWLNDPLAVTGWANAWQNSLHPGIVTWGNDIRFVKTNFTASGVINWVNSGAGHWQGTANAAGNAYAQGTKGDWGAKQSETSLVGELGQEILVRDGQWQLIGENGAEFKDIKKGDIIFNHKQSQELIKNGSINSRGQAYVNGTTGTAYSSGSGGFTGSGHKDLATITGGGNSGGGSKNPGGGSGGGNGGNGSGSPVSRAGTNPVGSDGSTADGNANINDADSFLETLNWIEIAISRIDRAISLLDATAQSTFKSWKVRNTSLSDEIGSIANEINVESQAYQKYMDEANAVGLSSYYATKVQNGTIEIENITDEDLYNKISDYQTWYEKALECQDAIDSLKETEAGLYQTAFNNVATEYESILTAIDNKKSLIDELINQTETSGYMVSAEFYNAQLENEQDNLDKLKNERDGLVQALTNAVNSKMITEGSEAWYEMTNSIDSVTLAIEQSNTALIDYSNSIRQISWDTFDMLENRISNITSETDFLIDLMSNKTLYNDNGTMTDVGISTMAMHGTNYNVYMEQSAQYAAEIKKLNDELAKDPNNQTLFDRRQSLLEQQRELISSAEQEKNAIKDMVEEGINKEIDSLTDLINKYNDALDSSKNLYDYQNKIKDQTKEIASIQKQLSAYQGDSSEETKSKVQELKVSLDSAQQDLEEMQYDQYISDQQKMLDDLSTEYETVLNQRLDNIDALISEMTAYLNTNSATIDATIKEQASAVGTAISTELTNIWTSEKDALTVYNAGLLSGLTSVKDGVSNSISSAVTSVNSVLNGMNVNLATMVSDLNTLADKKTDEANKSSASDPNSTITKPSGSTTTPTTTPTPTTPSNNTGLTDKDYYGVALAIWNGNYGWGTGQTRINNLKAKGFDAAKVQSIVNQMGVEGYVHTAAWIKKYYGIEQLTPFNISQYAIGAKKILKDQYAWTQENGTEAIIRPSDGAILTPLAKSDSVLKASASSNIFDFANNPTQFMKDLGFGNSLSNPNVQNVNNNTIQNDVNLTISLPNVNDYESFKTALQHDKNFERMIQSMTTGRVFGGSSLKKYNY